MKLGIWSVGGNVLEDTFLDERSCSVKQGKLSQHIACRALQMEYGDIEASTILPLNVPLRSALLFSWALNSLDAL